MSALEDALAVFTELGWVGSDVTAATHLPLGTADQQASARTGLRSGRLPRVENTNLLRLFAVRVGVPAPRAAALMRLSFGVPDAVRAAVLIERGREFAQAYVAVGARAGWQGVPALIDHFDLPVPEDADYLVAWGWQAVKALELDERHAAPENLPLMRRRFVDHAHAVSTTGAQVASVAAGTGLGAVLAEGVRRDFLARDAALELAFTGLDAATRPSDRAEWTRLILTEWAAGDAEVVARTDLLIGVLAAGDAPVVEGFTPPLLRAVDDDALADVLTTALLVPSGKAQRIVRTAAAARPEARELLAAWDAETEAAADPAPVTAAGWWQARPALWQVPFFEVPVDVNGGGAVEEALTEAYADLVPDVTDVVLEEFLVRAARLAYADPAAARRALRGRRRGGSTLRTLVECWVNQDDVPGYLANPSESARGGVATWRTTEVLLRLGELPALLSTPTWVDLRIAPSDLLGRLEQYAAASIAVRPADLTLAMLRLDRSLLTTSDETRLAGFGVSLEVPSTGDAEFDAYEFDAAAGRRLRQLVRRAGVLSAEEGARLLACATKPHAKAAEDVHAAIVEAWERGLLPVDVGGFDRGAAMARALLDVAPDGLAAPIWHLLDDALARSAAGSRLAAGTAELAEAMAVLAPEALDAVAHDVADARVLEVLGVRAVAARPGTSKAVAAARCVVALLP